MNWWQALITTLGIFGFAAAFVLFAAYITGGSDE